MNIKEYESRIKNLSFIEKKKEKRFLQDNIIMSASYLEKFPSKHWQEQIDLNRARLEIVEAYYEMAKT